MNSPIIILGPTSSGKTALSLWLAEQLGDVDILVVDSKQVYREQDITTGKDLPAHFQFSGYQNSTRSIRVFGVDLVDPDAEWSVSQFLSYANTVIMQAREKNRQLIIVGGTPQYLLSLFAPPQSAYVPPNTALRKDLDRQSVAQLQSQISEEKLHSMNDSDRQNPRRLIRAIEIEAYPSKPAAEEPILAPVECIWIGLRIEKEILEPRIRARVIDRIDQGAIEEYHAIKKKYQRWTPEARTAIGYAEIAQFLSGELDRDQLVDLWTLHEVQYAKRQMQWWKRESQIQWYDALDPDLKSHVLQSIKACYN